MSFDRETLIETCRKHGAVARIVVAEVRGSAPREVGASMLVWCDGCSGTIGGGTLEYAAIKAARHALEPGRFDLSRHALGPDLGQCCGGTVRLLTEVYDLATALSLPEDLIIRGAGEMPLAVARLKADARGTGLRPAPQFRDGWMIEPVAQAERDIWIWGAGHVGRALVGVLSPLPQLRLTWVDTAHPRFPAEIPDRVEVVAATKPAELVRHTPVSADHLIVTYSHALDLELCHRLLLHGFGFAGLIGSATKWARFRSRLSALGHGREMISGITCPIGRPELGKHPQAIALGVAADLLAPEVRVAKMEGIA
jgi:xanthine dehydrogenase accessory factor